jgi:hypothetical protein
VEHEIHEHIEHAAHEGGSHSSLPQWIGITVAVLGVIMALCSAQVGATRTELIATVVEEDGAKNHFQEVSNKYRALQAQLQHLHASMPNPEVLETRNAELKALAKEVKNPDTAQEIKAGDLQTDKILTTVTPAKDDVERFLKLIGRIREETGAAREWSESYHDAVGVHTSTAQRFEIALLCAEIGIVIASVGLLLSRRVHFARGALAIAVTLGVLSIGIAGVTKMVNTHTLHDAEQKIRAAEDHLASKNSDKDDFKDDKKLEDEILRNIERLTAGARGGL